MRNMYKILDSLTHIVTKIISYISVLFLILIIYMITKEGIKIFDHINFFDFIFGTRWKPLSSTASFGIKNMIEGTFVVTLIGISISMPISIGVSLFITLHIKSKAQNVVLGIIDLMSGVPSVVYGYFSFMTLVIIFEKYFSFASGESFLVAGITLALMILPFMISSITQTMIKVKKRYYSQAKALSLPPTYIGMKLIIPSSTKGILISLSIGLSRALGETMAVLMVIGNSNLEPELFGRGITLSGLIALEMGSAVIKSNHYSGLYAAGFVLMIILIFINILFGLLIKVVNKYV